MARRYVIGIDEVGRGPLAGPITVGAVAVTARSRRGDLHPKLRVLLKGIKDSKKLSVKQREEWHQRFLSLGGFTPKCQFIAVTASVGPAVIDRIGISRAASIAVGRCLHKLTINYKLKTTQQKIFLDGSLYAPFTYHNQETIIKGDEKVPVIAAASIVAKIKRDRAMLCLHKKIPQYGFAIHKGYGTKMHQYAIKKHGISSFHRKTFCSRLV